MISLKNPRTITVGLSEDEVGSGWNRAAQGLLATGRNLLVLHHRKKQAKNAKTGLDDVYGSTWLTSGMGSVVLLDGNPGDPLVEFRHLKFPVSEVGPMKVSHDQATGLMTVAERVDLVAVAQGEGKITVKRAAELLLRQHVGLTRWRRHVASSKSWQPQASWSRKARAGPPPIAPPAGHIISDSASRARALQSAPA